MNNQSAKKIAKAISTALMAGALLSCPLFATSAFAYGEADMINTLRTPITYGTPNSPAWVPAQEGAPPPCGDGFMPPAVTPGDCSTPFSPPSAVFVPLTMGGDKDEVNAWAMPYLTPPPSTAGYDSSSINGSSGGYGLQAPVSVVNICPQGGMVGDAPTQRWGGQRSYDFGKPNNVRPNSSRMNDFGQKLSEKPDLKMCPQFSQDGPRQRGEYRGQTTQDLHGNRTLFRDNQRSQLTIAPY
ncbi:MAG: hypothetical protein WCT03_02090 [Candidatus Obscuribacterales bacterium]